MLGKIKVILFPGKLLGKSILDSLLLAILFTDNYWILAKEDKEDIIINQARESPNNHFILILCISANY